MAEVPSLCDECRAETIAWLRLCADGYSTITNAKVALRETADALEKADVE